MVKTKEDAKKMLQSVMEAYGLETIVEAADYVLLHYNQWDYQGSDRLFLAYCEEILKDDGPTPKENI